MSGQETPVSALARDIRGGESEATNRRRLAPDYFRGCRCSTGDCSSCRCVENGFFCSTRCRCSNERCSNTARIYTPIHPGTINGSIRTQPVRGRLCEGASVGAPVVQRNLLPLLQDARHPVEPRVPRSPPQLPAGAQFVFAPPPTPPPFPDRPLFERAQSPQRHFEMDQLAQALQAILQQQSQQMELQQQQFGEMLDRRDQEARAAQEAAQRRFEQEIQQRQQHSRQLYEQRQQQFEEHLAHHQQQVREAQEAALQQQRRKLEAQINQRERENRQRFDFEARQALDNNARFYRQVQQEAERQQFHQTEA